MAEPGDAPVRLQSVDLSAIQLILGILLALTIQSTFDHAFKGVAALPDLQAIRNALFADFEKSMLLTLQTLVFLFTLLRFYWGAYRYSEEADRPTKFRDFFIDFAGIFVLFIGFYITSLIIATTILFYWAVAIFHILDFVLFLFVGALKNLKQELQSVIYKWLLFDFITFLVILVTFLFWPVRDYWSQWIALAVLLGIGLWDVIWLRKFYRK